MSLTPGARLGPYEIVAPPGAGGMGEVYRARDSRLNREVALKVLPDLFASDGDRLARFVREAQVLASLNHPHIAHIHGLEEFGVGTGGSGQAMHALVLELVDGPTLADHIARGPMPLGEAIAVAAQIAEALEAAHDQNIIHRDLKPAHVKLKGAWGPTPTHPSDSSRSPTLAAADVAGCKVKVLDFGLAKARAPDPVSSSSAMNSPTMSARATEMGMILGTAAYMSPEQARGRAADKRADIWAFGVVLFEMLTGRPVFSGETTSEVMASVMKDDPDWGRLPPNLPASIRRLLRRCLEKDPLASMEAHALAGTEGGHLPFWSPDSRQVGFFSVGKLKKMPVAGGTIETLCDAKDGRGASWGSQGMIVFAPDNAGGLESVPVSGGDPKPVTTLDSAKGETGHRFPWFLPDGRHFLFSTVPAKNQQFDLFVGSLDGTRSDVLTEGAGALAYLGDRLSDTKFVWLDRTGRETGTIAAPDGHYQEVAFSPDGRRAALVRFDIRGASDIWMA